MLQKFLCDQEMDPPVQGMLKIVSHQFTYFWLEMFCILYPCYSEIYACALA